MGYRSHVLFAIDSVAEVTLRLTVPDVVGLLDEADRIFDKNICGIPRYRVYDWDAVKWYDSWLPVSSLESWMGAACDNDDNEEPPFNFLRDGEELNDVEHQGSWGYGISHGITVDADYTPRITAETRGALALVLARVDSEWGEYKDPEFAKAVKLLECCI